MVQSDTADKQIEAKWQCSILKYSTVQYSAVQCSATHYNTTQCRTIHYFVPQYSTVEYRTVQQVYLWIWVLVSSCKHRGQNHSSWLCGSSSSLEGGTKKACKGCSGMEGEEEISISASMWNVPQHLPHRMLWCAWSIRRVERRQCWSLHFDSFVRGKGCLVPEVEGGLIIHLWCGVCVCRCQWSRCQWRCKCGY